MNEYVVDVLFKNGKELNFIVEGEDNAIYAVRKTVKHCYRDGKHGHISLGGYIINLENTSYIRIIKHTELEE